MEIPVYSHTHPFSHFLSKPTVNEKLMHLCNPLCPNHFQQWQHAAYLPISISPLPILCCRTLLPCWPFRCLPRLCRSLGRPFIPRMHSLFVSMCCRLSTLLQRLCRGGANGHHWKRNEGEMQQSDTIGHTSWMDAGASRWVLGTQLRGRGVCRGFMAYRILHSAFSQQPQSSRA